MNNATAIVKPLGMTRLGGGGNTGVNASHTPVMNAG